MSEKVNLNDESSQFKAEARIWDNAPKWRRALAFNHAFSYGYSWAHAMRNKGDVINLPLIRIRTLVRKDSTAALPSRWEYPRCHYEDVDGTSRPGFWNTFHHDDAHIFIPFEGDVALKLEITQSDGNVITNYFDVHGDCIRQERFNKDPRISEYKNLWDWVLTSVFPNIKITPTFPEACD